MGVRIARPVCAYVPTAGFRSVKVVTARDFWAEYPGRPTRKAKVVHPQQTVRQTAPLVALRGRWIVACMAKRSGNSPDAEQIALATIAVWADIAAALHSILGKQGVAALYNRSASLASRTHPWLGGSRAGSDNSVDLHALQSIVARQGNRDAAAGAGELLQTFYDVLVGLIGAELCDQLLISLREDAPHADREISKL
jgi:hypothetical protein